ncbi:zinc finger, C3HC4 type [Oesophagostomum dentatum]|uniref:Zinc finger, C3HC4 type n=1 Tax=Oesophagostomum dentatum TaxID=61180 RepID=A0A0B1TR22_OESDE|nr:zinc finger, C3HC4 type [Oesophagostomum dentatum]
MPRKHKIKLTMCPVANFFFEDKFLKPISPEEVRRCVIIDAPNVMHVTKTDYGVVFLKIIFRSDKANSGGLLALIRYFVKNDFDVIAVSQRKYTFETTVTHKFAVDRLERVGLIHLVDGHEYDDLIALEIAFAADGVIISNDTFSDHLQESARYAPLLSRCISVELDRLSTSEQYTMSSNGHCVAEHTFRFRRRVIPDNMMDQSPSSILHEAFFSTPDNTRHEIVKEHRENWTEDHKNKIISTIDELLAQIRYRFNYFQRFQFCNVFFSQEHCLKSCQIVKKLGIGEVLRRDSMAPSTRRQESLKFMALNARRAEARKMKTAVLREDAKRMKSYDKTSEVNDESKPTCFFDESLLACDICLEIMHNAMNVSPCNHKFCAGCIYEWNSLNPKCPKCRWSAVDITRDATLNSIIEQYLIAFPEKRRDKAQLIELDERELNHLERWERKRDSDVGDYDYDMEEEFYDVSSVFRRYKAETNLHYHF